MARDSRDLDLRPNGWNRRCTPFSGFALNDLEIVVIKRNREAGDLDTIKGESSVVLINTGRKLVVVGALKWLG